MTEPSVIEVLDHLEDLEMHLLAWGVVDTGFTREEVEEIAESLGVTDADEMIESLEERGLLVELRTTVGYLYRTRMAETVRLLVRLRQLFPNRSWQSSPQLVSDFRFEIGPRFVPRRHLSPERVIAYLSQLDSWQESDRSTLTAMLEPSVSAPARSLSDFQLRATSSVQEGLAARGDTATVVCAGTGSGKTLGFYLPALTTVLQLLDNSYWAKIVAVYPRNELLKDQLRTALQETTRLQDSLSTERNVLLGAYFGFTPQSAKATQLEHIGWDRHGNGWRCPFLTCIDDSCNGAMVWSEGDIAKKKERLECSLCSQVIDGTQLALTRDSMRKRPPDLLFGSAEMLNRVLSDSESWHIFGVGTGKAKRPRLLLLDEIHTYSGTAGAHTAMVIRRWRNSFAGTVHCVGLSATLEGPRQFFAQLTGVPEERITVVEPAETELEPIGKQYAIALKGDPASQTALLSTTIQASMLLRRSLDPYDNRISQGAYGNKLFIFTDDLDVTNRLFFQMRDAEGQTNRGHPNRKGPLAALRATAAGDADARMADGQLWHLSEELGHSLSGSDLLKVTRTSSQDAGVDAKADIVVATAALEVGFDDPTVGAVVQHKAPQNMAQFIQRRGRAGRSVNMRPWTAVVLSDYGRDRTSFQTYDQLFTPTVALTRLPIGNRYVLRMQAGFTFLDWIAGQLDEAGVVGGSTWKDMSGPAAKIQKTWKKNAETRQRAALAIAVEVLENPTRERQFREHLMKALELDADEVLALMWEPPRSLMLGFIPTLVRRLQSDWVSSVGDIDLFTKDPLPDFLPPNLFTDLNLPEVKIDLQNETSELLGIRQTLSELAPGRLTHRYAVAWQGERAWLVPDAYQVGTEGTIDVASQMDCEDIGFFEYFGGGGIERIRCVRPWRIRTEAPPAAVEDRTNARPIWFWDIASNGEAVEVPVPSAAWSSVISSLEFSLHALGASTTVSRFSTGSNAEIAAKGFPVSEVSFDYVQKGERVAVGYSLEVDGIRINCILPSRLEDFCLEDDPVLTRSLRTQYFDHLVSESEKIASAANQFQQEWLSQLFRSVVTTRAVATGLEVADVLSSASVDDCRQDMLTVFDEVYQSAGLGSINEDGTAQTSPLRTSIVGILNEENLIDELRSCAQVAFGEIQTSWLPWLRQRLLATIGAAFVHGMQLLCPEFDTGGLSVDLHKGGRDDPAKSAEIRISETTIGGAGFIEEFFARYSDDPRRFFQLMSGALEPADLETVDEELSATLVALSTDETLRDKFDLFRSARNNGERVTAHRGITKALQSRGLISSQSARVALASRLLKAGSSSEIDRMLLELIVNWGENEERLGIEIDNRTMAYVASGTETFQKMLGVGLAVGSSDRLERFSILNSLLWPRGSSVRSNALRWFSPFAAPVLTERLLLRRFVSTAGMQVVGIDEEGWSERFQLLLRSNGQVAVSSPTIQSSS